MCLLQADVVYETRTFCYSVKGLLSFRMTLIMLLLGT